MVGGKMGGWVEVKAVFRFLKAIKNRLLNSGFVNIQLATLSIAP
jgi:hypothetical protein